MSTIDHNSNNLDLELLTQDIWKYTNHTTAGTSQEAQCCCGQRDCQLLRRSQNMLSELESQVQVAGSLGQALLERHEKSMKEAETRQNTLSVMIAELEMKSAKLELDNSRTIQENKQLLLALEEVNGNISQAENRVKELQTELDAAHAEVLRISAYAARTEILEAQLAILESEQEELRNTIATSKEEEKSAIARWKRSERSLIDLERQLERIEQEHSLEKARSQNIAERLEQRKYSKHVLGRYPNDLSDKTGLSQFMKEILSENGHLQIGVQELRDMLAVSQGEVNMLRDKLENVEFDRREAIRKGKSPLSMELDRPPPGNTQTIVHHHHYHTPPTKDKLPAKSRAGKLSRRTGVASGHNVNTGLGLIVGSSPPDKLAKRWSAQTRSSNLSLATSTISTFQEPSIFDGIETGSTTSRPTSADTDYPLNANKDNWAKYGRTTLHANPPPFSVLHTTEVGEGDSYDLNCSMPPVSQRRLGLERSVSHESLLSVMAVSHLASPAMSQLSASSGGFIPRTPIFSAPTTSKDPEAIITPGIAIRDPSRVESNSAYSRLLGLHQESTSPPIKSSSRKAPASGGGSSGWFWRWGSSVVDSKEHTDDRGNKKIIAKPSAQYINERLLKESLADGQELV
ncbi:hypothetical protein EDC01DRAFT_631865 [Geopyxis carbonaria]|nr:hypothetical protein EDC01DRAFT_631865 [Geopyxis carbonaria]